MNKMTTKEFRTELVKIMPGYNWTVHRRSGWLLKATGTQVSGRNRTSTLSVERVEKEGQRLFYEVKSAGYGLQAEWLHTNQDATLASALRGLQDHYEHKANTYYSHAEALKRGRKGATSSTKEHHV